MCLVIQEAPWCKRLGQLPQWVSLVVSTCMGHESHETCRCACSSGSCSRNPLGTPGLSVCTWHEGNLQGMLVSRSCPHCLRSSDRASKELEKSWKIQGFGSISVKALWLMISVWPFGMSFQFPESFTWKWSAGILESCTKRMVEQHRGSKMGVANNVSIFSKSKIFTLVYDVETKRSSSSTERYGATLFEPQMFLLWPCIKTWVLTCSRNCTWGLLSWKSEVFSFSSKSVTFHSCDLRCLPRR